MARVRRKRICLKWTFFVFKFFVTKNSPTGSNFEIKRNLNKISKLLALERFFFRGREVGGLTSKLVDALPEALWQGFTVWSLLKFWYRKPHFTKRQFEGVHQKQFFEFFSKNNLF